MLRQFTRKHRRDQALIARWQQLDDRLFARIPRDRLQQAQLGLQGHIVLPGDPDYDADRKLFNPVFDAYPAAIVYCVVESDGAIALQLAKDVTQPFTVRSGGHCTAGFSAGAGVLIDVSGLAGIAIDTTAQTATVGWVFGLPSQEDEPEIAMDGTLAGTPDTTCYVAIAGEEPSGLSGFTVVALPVAPLVEAARASLDAVRSR